MMEKYYSTQQIAEMCHVTRGSVIRWIREGKLQAGMTAGGHSRVPAAEIVKLLESLRMPVPAELAGVRMKALNRLSKVLIVDDEPSICELLELFFEQFFPEVEVKEARNGFDAGMLAGSFCPDLIMLDLKAWTGLKCARKFEARRN
jgi:two-component system, OmpR family, response regulator